MLNLEKLLEGKELSDGFYVALASAFCGSPEILDCNDCVGFIKCSECSKKPCPIKCPCDLILGKWLLEEVKE